MTVGNSLQNLKYQTGRRLPRAAEKGGFPYLYYPQLEELNVVDHLVSTRLGGVSDGIWATLNLSFSRGDRSDRVRENLHRVAGALGISESAMVFTDQTHTTNIRLVTKADCGKGVTRKLDYKDIDGLVTNEPGVCLAAFFADCVPLLFVDPVRKAIGLSHSGWRGTVHEMGRHTVERMTAEFGTDPADLYAAIGPSIGQCCYEVSEEVIEACREVFPEKDWPSMFYQKENGRYQLDLRRACMLTMLYAGIPEDHISVTDLCTCCNPDLLFSHRASQGKRGNLGVFLCLRKEGS